MTREWRKRLSGAPGRGGCRAPQRSNLHPNWAWPELGVAPLAIGQAANRLGIKITDCQLGCFGRARKDKAAE